MTPRAFEIAMISSSGKQTRTIIAHGSVQAIRTALTTFDEPKSSFAITCTRLADLPDLMEEQPCAA
jgi:hypothetical protein